MSMSAWGRAPAEPAGERSLAPPPSALPALSAPAASAAPCALARERLLWVYAAGPMLLAVALLDHLWAGGAWQALFSQAPAALPFYGVVFGFPHVLASFFLLGDKTLARAAAPVLAPAAAAAGILTALAWWLLDSRELALALIVSTMVHVLGQQSGLAAGQAGLARHGSPWLTRLWRALLAVTGCATAMALGGESRVQVVAEPMFWLQCGNVALLLSTLLAGVLSYRARRQGGDVRALLALQGTVLLGQGLVLAGYPLLGIWLFRLVHDVTAFLVYAALANARAQAAPGANRLYALLRLPARRPGLLLWPLATGLTVLLAGVAPLAFFVALTWLHYLAEHRLWRGAAGLRRHLAMA
jgi:hypothetical protein